MLRLVLPVLVSLLAASALAQAPDDVVVVVGKGAGISQELTDDATEAVIFSIGQERGLNCLAKEKVQGKIEYAGPRQPGSCVFDNECLRRAHKALATRWFVIARVEQTKAGYGITVSRIADIADLDETLDGESSKGASDLINKTRALVAKVLQDPPALLGVKTSEPDADIAINGKSSGSGSLSTKVKSGSYLVRVTKEGFEPFEGRAECRSGRPCSVSASLVKSKVVVPDKGTPEIPNVVKPLPSGRGKALVIAGWTTAGVGAALAVVGTLYGLKAKKLQSDLDDACAVEPCTLTHAEAEQKEQDGKTNARIFNFVGVPGMALFVGGIAMAIVGHTLPTPTPGTKLEVNPVFGPGGTYGIEANFRF